MAQATLASIRHYCPNVPIALLVDGSFDVRYLEDQYGVIPLRVDDLPDPEMRKLVSRSYHAKHVPMWEGPFERFVWVDADAIVWGDFTAQLRTDVDFQIFWDDLVTVPAGTEEVPSWMSHFYFDPIRLKEHDPDFRWQNNPYFCPGTFAARRNAIPFTDYANVAALAEKNPGLFAWGDMGIINYLVLSGAQRGTLKTAVTDLQHIWEHHGKEELMADCKGCGWQFPKIIKRPRVAHFCGRKPHLFDPGSYSKPFTIARLEHYRHTHCEFGAWTSVLKEEAGVLAEKLQRRLARIVGSFSKKT